MYDKKLKNGGFSNCKIKTVNDVSSESDITPCNKIDKPLVVYRF